MSKSITESLLFKITVEQTGATSAQLDTLAKSINNLKTASSGLTGAGSKGFAQSLREMGTNSDSLNRSIGTLNSNLSKVGSGAGSASIKRLSGDIQQASQAMVSGGRAADSYAASNQKIKGPLDNLNASLRNNVNSLNLQKSAAATATQGNNILAASMERIAGINVQMSRSNMQAAESLSMQGRSADSAAASYQRMGQAAQQSSASIARMGAVNRTANMAQSEGVNFDKQRNQEIMHQVRQVSGLAMGFGVLAMSMDSVVGMGDMLAMQEEKRAMAHERVNKALEEHGKGSHQYEQAVAALAKAERGYNYIQREVTFAYHNMLFMIGVVAMQLMGDLLPAILRITPKLKEMGAAALAALAPMKTAAAGIGSAFATMAGNIGLNVGKANNALKGLSTISKAESKTVESAMAALGAQAAMVLGSSIPMNIDTARRAYTNFTFESEAQKNKFAKIMGEYENVAKMAMAGAAAEVGAAATNINRNWSRAADGAVDFETRSKTPINNFKNSVFDADSTVSSATRNMGDNYLRMTSTVSAGAEVIDAATDVFDSNGRKITENAVKVGGLRAAFAGLGIMAKTGVAAIIAAGAAIVLYGTNALGARDAINGFGVELGKIHPAIKATGEALVGLAGVFGLTGESAQKTVGHFQTASSTISTAWHNMVADMQSSNDKMTSDMGDTMTEINGVFSLMSEHLGGQLEKTQSTWDKFWQQIENRDYKGAVDTIEQSFAALVPIFQQIAADGILAFAELGEGLATHGENMKTKMGGALQWIVGRFQTEFDKAGKILESWGANAGGIITEVFSRIGAGLTQRGAEIQKWIDDNLVKPFNEWKSKIKAPSLDEIWKTLGLDGLVEKATNIVTGIGAAFAAIPSNVQNVLDKVWTGLGLDKLVENATNIVSGIGAAFAAIPNNVQNVLDGVWKGLGLDKLIENATNIVSGIGSTFASIPSNVNNILQQVWSKLGLEGLIKHATEIVGGIGSALSGIAGNVQNVLSGVWDKLGLAGLQKNAANIAGQAGGAIMGIAGYIQDQTEQVWNRLLNGSAMVQKAQALGQQIWEGITSVLGGAQANAENDIAQTKELLGGAGSWFSNLITPQAQQANALNDINKTAIQQQAAPTEKPKAGEAPLPDYLTKAGVGLDPFATPTTDPQLELAAKLAAQQSGAASDAAAAGAASDWGPSFGIAPTDLNAPKKPPAIAPWWQTRDLAALNKPGTQTGLGDWGNMLTKRGPAMMKEVPQFDEHGDPKMIETEGGKEIQEKKMEPTVYGEVAAAVEGAKTAIAEYNDMLTTSNGVTQNSIGLAKLFEKGVVDQTLKQYEMEAATHTTAGTIQKWGEQLNDAAYKSTLMKTGAQEAAMEMLGMKEGVVQNSGALSEWEAALAKGTIQGTAFVMGQQEQRQALVDTQLETANHRGQIEQLSSGLASGQVQLTNWNSGLEQGRLDIMEQEAALSTTNGTLEAYRETLNNGQMTNIAFTQGVQEQKQNLIDTEIAVANTIGRHQELNMQLLNGTAQQANFNLGLAETRLKFTEQTAALSTMSGEIQGYSEALFTGLAQNNAFREGVQEQIRAFQDAEIQISKSRGELLVYHSYLREGIPQWQAYSQAILDAQMANLQLHTEMAALVGTGQVLATALRDTRTIAVENGIAFQEAANSAMEWGMELMTADQAHAGFRNGLQTVANALGNDMPIAFSSSNEAAQEFVAVMAGVKTSVAEMASSLEEGGKNIISGLANGFGEGMKDVDEKIEELEEKLGVNLPKGIEQAMENMNLGGNAKQSLDQQLQLLMASFRDPNVGREDIAAMGQNMTEMFNTWIGSLPADVQSTATASINAITDMLANPPALDASAAVWGNYGAQIGAHLDNIGRAAGIANPILAQITAQDPSGQIPQWQSLTASLQAMNIPIPSILQNLTELGQVPVGATVSGISALGTAIAGVESTSSPLPSRFAAMGQGLMTTATNSGTAATNLTTAGTAATGVGTATGTATTQLATFTAEMGTMASVTQQVLTNIHAQFTTQFAAIFAVVQTQATVFMTTMTSTFTTGITAMTAPISTTFTTVFTTAFTTVQTAATTFLTTLQTSFTTAMTMITTPVTTTLPLAFTTAFTAIQAAATTFFTTLSSSMTTFMTQSQTTIAQLPTYFQSSFDQITSAGQTFFTAMVSTTQTNVQTMSTTFQTLVPLVTDTFNKAQQAAAHAMATMSQNVAKEIQAQSRTIAEIVRIFDENFKRGTNAAWHYIKQLGQLTVQAMNTIVQAADRAAQAMEGIGQAARSAESQVQSLISALNSIPREITVRIRVVADPVPSYGGLAEGTAGALYMADGGGIYGLGNKRKNSRVVVGESGDEDVIRTGLNSRRTTLERVTHQTVLKDLGRREPELLTVVPLEGNNARRFREKHPEFFAGGTYNVGSAQIDAYKAAMAYSSGRTPMTDNISRMLYGRIIRDKKGNVTIDGRLVMREGAPVDYDAWEGRHHGMRGSRKKYRRINGSNENIKGQGMPFHFGDDWMFNEGRFVVGANASTRRAASVVGDDTYYGGRRIGGAGGAAAGTAEEIDAGEMVTTDRLMQSQRAYNDYISERVARARDRPRSQQQDEVYGTANNDIASSLEERSDFAKMAMAEEEAATINENRRTRGANTFGPKRNFEEDYTVFMKQLVDKIAGKIDGKIRINIHSQVDERIWGKMTNKKLLNDFSRS